MYNGGEAGCSKKKLGTYEVTVDKFAKALIKQKILEYYMTYGKEMKVDKNSITYLTCNQYYYNNNLVRLLIPPVIIGGHICLITANCISIMSS
jgi:hypothetical protein